MVTQAQREAADAYKKRIAGEQVENEKLKEETPTQRSRTFLQGITFGTADELEAYIRSIGSEREYEDLVNEIRGNLSAYKDARPIEAASTEIAGAAAPAIIATILTGGGALPAIATRLPLLNNLIGRVFGRLLGTRGTQTVTGGVAVGGGQGAVTGFGTAEGGVGERLDETIIGAGTGMVLGAGGEVAGKIIGKTIGGLIDHARRRFGNRASAVAEREIQRLAQERGITPEDAFQQLMDGSILAENVTMRDMVRTYRATGGEAAAELQKGLRGRKKETREAVVTALESGFGVTNRNILKQQTTRLDDLGNKASSLYDDADWGKTPVPQQFVTSMANIFSRVPRAFDEVKEAMQISGEKMFFSLDKAGNVKVTGTPTIAQAEKVRTAISNRVNALYKADQPLAAKALKEVELELRGIIDNISPQTQQARQTYSQMMSENDAWETARKLTTASPDFDLLQTEWDRVLVQGDEQIKAFRLGVMSKLRRMLASGSSAGTIKKMLDENNSMRSVLEEVFPEQELPEMLRKLSVSKLANDTVNEVLGSSPTSITTELVKRQKGDVDLLDLGLDMATGSSTIALGRLLLRGLKKADPQLTDGQRTEIVQIMLSRDANRIKQILQDDSGLAVLQDYLKTTANTLKRGGLRVATQTQAQNPEFQGNLMQRLSNQPQ
jgi:hypothetical protein